MKIYVDVGIDLENQTYTLFHYLKDGTQFDEITLPIQDDVAKTVLVTLDGHYISTEVVPDKLYEDMAVYLIKNDRKEKYGEAC